jgi:hypothetical protein
MVRCDVDVVVISLTIDCIGTHCVGTIAALAPKATFFVGKVFDEYKADETGKWMTAPGEIKVLCEAIYHAVDVFGCHALSLSCGTRAYSAELEDAIQYAAQRGVIILCAAANYGRLLKNNISYPAAFGNVICVGSHSVHGDASVFSSAGREVDFLAPGENVLSAVYNGGKGGRSGTSMAVPFVTALAALLATFMADRGVLLNCEITRMLLRALCSSEHTSKRGYGVLDVEFLLLQGEAFIVNTLVDRGVRVPFASSRVAQLTADNYAGEPRDAFGSSKVEMTVLKQSAEWLKQAKPSQKFIGIVLCDFNKIGDMTTTAENLNLERLDCPIGTLILLPTQDNPSVANADNNVDSNADNNNQSGNDNNNNDDDDDDDKEDKLANNDNNMVVDNDGNNNDNDNLNIDKDTCNFPAKRFNLAGVEHEFLYRDVALIDARRSALMAAFTLRHTSGLRRRAGAPEMDLEQMLSDIPTVHNQAAKLIAPLINVDRVSFLGCSVTKKADNEVTIDTNSGTLHTARFRNHIVNDLFDNDGRALTEQGKWRDQFEDAFASKELDFNAVFGDNTSQ